MKYVNWLEYPLIIGKEKVLKNEFFFYVWFIIEDMEKKNYI